MEFSDITSSITRFLDENNRKSALKMFKTSGDVRVKFYGKISSFIAAGVPIMKILSTIERQKAKGKSPDKDPEYVVVTYLLDQINSGEKFSNALKSVVPGEEFLLISTGEKSGQLSKNIGICIGIINDNAVIKKTVSSALTYPSIMVLSLIALFYGLGAKMLPTLESVAPVSDWSAQGRILHMLATWVVDNVFFIFAFIIIFATVIVLTLPRLVNEFRTKYLDNIHPYKMYRTIQSTFFLMSMSSLLSSGVKASDSLVFLQENSKPYTAYQIEKMIVRLTSGAKAATVIATEFLGEAADDIELYGMAGQFDEALMNTAILSKEKTKESIDTFSARVGTIMFALIGLSTVWSISAFLSISSSIALSQAN